MESEKVKEIKKALECCKQNEIENTCEYCSNCPASDWDYETECNVELFQKALTLINELESENERLVKALEDMPIPFMGCMLENQLLSDISKEKNGEIKALKDRIAELEKEIEENAFYSKGYAQGIKNTYEVVIPEKLKQFAERLKEKAIKLGWEGLGTTDIDETLKEFLERENS